MPNANFVTVGSTQLSNGEVMYNGVQAVNYTQVKVYAIALGYYSNAAIHAAVFA